MAGASLLELDDDLNGRVMSLASARRRSANAIMREAIVQYVEREEQRDGFRRSAMEAWHHYERTGLHVTAEEADAWLARLEAGEDADPPDCHA